jgi:hypothetical protein
MYVKSDTVTELRCMTSFLFPFERDGKSGSFDITSKQKSRLIDLAEVKSVRSAGSNKRPPLLGIPEWMRRPQTPTGRRTFKKNGKNRRAIKDLVIETCMSEGSFSSSATICISCWTLANPTISRPKRVSVSVAPSPYNRIFIGFGEVSQRILVPFEA